jgi:hypothetical protein
MSFDVLMHEEKRSDSFYTVKKNVRDAYDLQRMSSDT